MVNYFRKFIDCLYRSIPVAIVLTSWAVAQEVSTQKQFFSGWLMVFVITALLAGIAWVAMYQKKGRKRIFGDQITIDLNDKLRKGEISRNEYESRKRDLDL